MKIFVSNLSFAATEADVKTLFEGLGAVSSVVIQMEKKAAKSRGFGFVDMPDVKQAQAAIASLNDQEFMGRPLIVNPARIKSEPGWSGIKKEPGQTTSAAGTPSDRSEGRTDRPRIRTWHDSSFYKGGGHKSARGSWPDRPSSASSETARPAHKISERSYDRRDSGHSKPWPKGPERFKPSRKSAGDSRPWKKPEGDARSWKKSAGDSRPWRKPAGDSHPWKKPEGDARPWKKSAGDSRPWKKPAGDSRPFKKFEGDSRPWKKPAGDSRPWKKPEGDARPWKKSAGDSRPWRKPAGDSRPWKKPEGDARPLEKSAGDSRPWKKPAGDSRPWKKPEGDARPWKKSAGPSRPWKKAGSESKPWRKSNDPRQ